MKNIVYIIGAGFSAPLNVPTMKNFYRISQKLNISDRPHFKRIFDYSEKTSPVKHFANINMMNIEELLSLLEMDNYLNKSELINDMKLYISDVVKVTLSFDGNSNFSNEKHDFPEDWYLRIFTKHKEKLYGYFLLSLLGVDISKRSDHTSWNFSFQKTDNKVPNYALISFNYDLLFEKIEETILSSLPSSDENTKLISNGSNLGLIELIKLHGSADDYNTIIPPTWNKLQSEERRNYWKRAYDLLNDADEIRILGYSLPHTDTYFKYFLTCCLRNSKKLEKFTVITLDNDNRTRGNYENFFDKNFDIFEFYSADIEKYLSCIYHAFESNLEKYLHITNDYFPALGFSTFGVEKGHLEFTENYKT